MFLKLVSLALFGVFILSGCAKHPRYDATPAISVTSDESVTEEQKGLFELDLKTLNWATPRDVPQKNILGLREISNKTLSEWLQKRMHFLVGEGFLSKRIQASTQEVSQPPEIIDTQSIANTKRSVTMMSNIGTLIYIKGKELKQIIKVAVGDEIARIDSPRVGMMMIGPGLFSGTVKHFSGSQDSLKNSLARLSVYFHEARHSDGNGVHTGFSHSICPDGDYRGIGACDSATNGPYTVGKIVLQSLVASCDECDESEKESLNLLIADCSLRVLDNATHKDDRAERLNP